MEIVVYDENGLITLQLTELLLSYFVNFSNKSFVMTRTGNALINSSSPYLLQHAYNPVNWNPWSKGLLERAIKENKLLLISIGYSSCHWCHVMEKESFEDKVVAELMNDNFICIKVDREERPDVDFYYMTAVQLMQQRGGWPLNVIALPDGRAIWGGTYFTKDMWLKNLQAIAEFHKEHPEKTADYAERLQQGIRQLAMPGEDNANQSVNIEILQKSVERWLVDLDREEGGQKGAPKFPMPVNLLFLLNFSVLNEDKSIQAYVHNTLKKMARGGIYDQLGGGFSRYSTDRKWKVPHFEKMLYDNGQLISLYSKGFQFFKDDEFKNVAFETIRFLEKEMKDESGGFYSALDADSEGEEGKFYTWEKKEIEELLTNDLDIFSEYFGVNRDGYWENNRYILLRKESDATVAPKYRLSPQQLKEKVLSWKEKLLKVRSKRVRPGVDDKILSSWNALVLTGLTDAYMAFQEKWILDLALVNAGFIRENLMDESGKIFHSWKNGKKYVDGFLEDYALVTRAILKLFEITGRIEWYELAARITNFTVRNFYDEDKGFFYFYAKGEDTGVMNHFQKEDNVIPSANSVMAGNLHRIYLIDQKKEYAVMYKRMVSTMQERFNSYPMAYANWGILMLNMTMPFYEVVIAGRSAGEFFNALNQDFFPDVLWAMTYENSDLPLFKNRLVKNENYIYICEEGTCRLPVKSADKARTLLGKMKRSV